MRDIWWTPSAVHLFMGPRFDTLGRVMANVQLAAKTGGLAAGNETVSVGKFKSASVKVLENRNLCMDYQFGFLVGFQDPIENVEFMVQMAQSLLITL